MNAFLHFFTKKDSFLTCVFTAEGAEPAEIEKGKFGGVDFLKQHWDKEIFDTDFTD